MVDNNNPTNQFHPYQPETSTPAAERPASGFGSIMERAGLGDAMKNFDMKGSMDKARSYAQANPAKVLGGLAAAVIGAGLLRGRRMS